MAKVNYNVDNTFKISIHKMTGGGRSVLIKEALTCLRYLMHMLSLKSCDKERMIGMIEMNGYLGTPLTLAITIKNARQLYGRVHVVLCGDLFQLEPVRNKNRAVKKKAKENQTPNN